MDGMIPILAKRLKIKLPAARPSAFKQHVIAGNMALESRRWPEAQAGYEAALALEPKLPAIWVQYGHALKEQGFLTEAEAAYRRSLELDAAKADTHLQLGHALKLQGRHDDARRAYATAFHIDPTLDDSWRELVALAGC